MNTIEREMTVKELAQYLGCPQYDICNAIFRLTRGKKGDVLGEIRKFKSRGIGTRLLTPEQSSMIVDDITLNKKKYHPSNKDRVSKRKSNCSDISELHINDVLPSKLPSNYPVDDTTTQDEDKVVCEALAILKRRAERYREIADMTSRSIALIAHELKFDIDE